MKLLAMLALLSWAVAQPQSALEWDEAGRALLYPASGGTVALPPEHLGSLFGPGVRPFEGVALRLALVNQGPRPAIWGLLEQLRPAWEALSGATLELLEAPPEALPPAHPAALPEGPLHGVVSSAWLLGSFVRSGGVQSLEQYLDDPRFPHWNPDWWPGAERALHLWQGEVTAVPLGASGLYLYWREDILADPVWQERFLTEEGRALPYPPETWSDVLLIARYFNGRNWNAEDADPDHGLVAPLGDDAMLAFLHAAVAAPAGLARDRCRPLFWFRPDDLTSHVNTGLHLRALEFWQQLFAQGPAQQLTFDLAASQAHFLRGKAVLSVAPASLAQIAQDETRSRVKGKLGVMALPGHRLVEDQCTGASLELRTPNALANAFGPAWQGLVLAEGQEAEAMYSFLALLASEGVHRWSLTQSALGVAPGLSLDQPLLEGGTTLEDHLDDYAAAGWHPGDLSALLSAQRSDAARPLSHPYLRLDATGLLYQALAQNVRGALLGRLQAQEALDLTAAAWQDVINQRGREALVEQYELGPGAP